MKRKPHVQLNVYLSETDYDVDVLVHGNLVWNQARSFPTNRKLEIEKARWVNALAALTEQLRKDERD